MAGQQQTAGAKPVFSVGEVGGPPFEISTLAVASVIVSMALVAVGNGMMFAFIPVRLGAEGFAPTWAGSILTGLSAGGIAGCLLTAPLVRRVGHARAYLVLSALIVLSNALIGMGTFPLAWIAARMLYGFAICSLFIVAQSWLNDAVANAIRGRVTAVFYVSYVMGLGTGAFLMGFLDIDTAQAPLVGIIFTGLSILPVGLTRLPQPPAPAAASIALLRAWRISPVGVAGMLAVGGLSMMIAGFAPIHATAKGYSQTQVATLLFAMPLGTLLFQIPFGWISDRTDRRYVLVAAAVIVMLAGVAAHSFDQSPIPVIIIIYVVWSGASDSIYSLAGAHANDRAAKADMVGLSSSMLFAWSVAGFIVPGIATALTAAYGTQSFILVAIALAAAYGVFVIWRVVTTGPATTAYPLGFQPRTGQVPPGLDARSRSEDR